jgi:hypothetical protein
MAAGAYLSAKGFGTGQEAQAGGFHEIEVPPGIELAGKDDLAIKLMYRLHQKDVYMIEHRRNSTKVAELRLLRQGAVGERPEKESYVKHPSLWFMASRWNLKGGVHREVISEDELRRKNEALYYFAEAVQGYMDFWERKDTGNYQPAAFEDRFENDFLRTIVTSAGFPNNSHKEIDPDLQDPHHIKNFMDVEIVPAIKKRPEDQRRVFAWTTFLLTTHYDFLGKRKPLGNLMFEYEKVGKEIYGRIRGPPLYGLSSEV